jgi:hypothetical protein
MPHADTKFLDHPCCSCLLHFYTHPLMRTTNAFAHTAIHSRYLDISDAVSDTALYQRAELPPHAW